MLTLYKIPNAANSNTLFTIKKQNMKKIKISLAVIAFCIGIGLSAYTVPGKHYTSGWFTITAPAHPELASSYTYSGTTSPCSGSSGLCAIEGTVDPSDMDRPLQSSVDQAKSDSKTFTQTVPGEVTFKP